MATGNSGSMATVRENFALNAPAVLAVPTGAAASVLAGPTKQGQTLIVKSFSRIINTSGADRTVSFYLVPTGGAAADSNCIGKNLPVAADRWLPFGELYVPYGYHLQGLGSASGLNLYWNYLLED